MSTTVLKVTGMHCPSCAGHVRRALEAVAGVSSARVNLETGEATIQHEETAREALVAAVDEAGYEAA